MTDKQEFLGKLNVIESGEDEHGSYEIVPISMVRGGELKPTKVYKKPMRHIVNSSNPSPRGWYKDKNTPDRVRPRPCFSEALLTTPWGGWCSVNCNFCYVAHGTRGYRSSGIATANPKYPDYMRQAISKMNVCPAAYISSFTEPFQKVEDEYHVVQRLSQVLVDEGLPLFYLSRKIPHEWAVDMLLANPYSYMQWSVNTGNNEQYR